MGYAVELVDDLSMAVQQVCEIEHPVALHHAD
jgi:hypothetical protein